jgi:hypothetical protein
MRDDEVNEEKEYLERLVIEAQETIYFFSSGRKPERERSACAAFLRCLGINFRSEEIISSQKDPPDVVFRSARFEVLEVLDQGRKRHDEWQAKRERRKQAKKLANLLRPYRPPNPMSYAEVLNLITQALAKKAARYGQSTCAGLDALVYVNILSNVLDTQSPIPSTDELSHQGWCSVSMIMPLFSHVFFTRESAPTFLQRFAGQTRNKREDLDTLFKL